MRGVYVKMTPFQLPISNNNEQLLGPPMPKIVPNFHPSLFHRLGGGSRDSQKKGLDLIAGRFSRYILPFLVSWQILIRF